MIRKATSLYLIIIAISIIMVLVISVLPAIQRYDKEYLNIHNEVALDFKSQMNYGALFNTENDKLQSLYDLTVKNGENDIKKAEDQIGQAEETINTCKAMVGKDKTLVESQLLRMKETGELLGKIDKQKVNKETIISLHDSLLKLLNTYNQALDQYDEVLTKEQQMYAALKAEKDLKEVSMIIDEVNQSSSNLSTTINDLNGYIESYNNIQI